MRSHKIFVAIGILGLSMLASPVVAAESAEHVVIDYLAAWNMHDAPRAAAHFAYNVTYFEPTAGKTLSGRDAAEASVVHNFLNVMPDAVWMLRGDHVVDGDKIAFEWEFSGTNTGMWADGTMPTGKHIVLHGMSLFRVVDGKIVYQADYYDPDSAIGRLGVM